MKIRIKGSSLLFRMRKHNIAILCNNGPLIEMTELSETTDQQIEFSLERGDHKKINIMYKNNTIISLFPEKLDEWNNTVVPKRKKWEILSSNRILN